MFTVTGGKHVLHVKSFVSHDWISLVHHLCQVASLNNLHVTYRTSIGWRNIGDMPSRCHPNKHLVCISVVINCESSLLGSSCCRLFNWAFSAIKNCSSDWKFCFKVTWSKASNGITFWPYTYFSPLLYEHTKTNQQQNQSRVCIATEGIFAHSTKSKWC